jgi:Flp pilus assembly protein TadD
MTTPAQALDLALCAHRAGEFARAEQLCRQILQLDPGYAEALHLLGLISVRMGRRDQAIDYIGQAIHLEPDFAPAHNNLGLALVECGRLEEATHDVAIEALMTIRGLSVDEAEALVLDAAFPGDPFASHG